MLTAERFLRSGKVRDLYELADGRLLLVASDRISAFDVVLPTEIPDKGRVLTGLSRFWFAETAGIVPNHLLDTDPAVLRDAIEIVVEGAPTRPVGPYLIDDLSTLRGRIMLCQPAEVVPIEAVVRGYLSGSGWKEYQATGSVCGVAIPPGLHESDRLPEPIFTPATKAEIGAHDENIDFDRMVAHIAGADGFTSDMAGPIAETVRARSISLYRYAAAVAARAGILLADTKFEFGFGFPWAPQVQVGPRGEQLDDPPRQPIGRRAEGVRWAPVEDHLILIDEALTPDSSRFWDAETYEPGRTQASFDKQFVRDWLEAQDWDKTAPGPELPADVVAGTRARYVAAFERITGASFDRYLADDVIAR